MFYQMFYSLGTRIETMQLHSYACLFMNVEKYFLFWRCGLDQNVIGYGGAKYSCAYSEKEGGCSIYSIDVLYSEQPNCATRNRGVLRPHLLTAPQPLLNTKIDFIKLTEIKITETQIYIQHTYYDQRE